jgi:uncharacterized protein YdaU (DUF1376 family)
MHWYPRFMDDYDRDTQHLSLMENGAYNRLLDYYYAKRKALPLDDLALYRICRAFTPEEQGAVRNVLTQFFNEQSDGWHQKRADQEIAKAKEISAVRSTAARTRYGKSEVTNSEGIAEEEKVEGERIIAANDLQMQVQLHSKSTANVDANAMQLHAQITDQRSTNHNTQNTDHKSQKSSEARVTARQPRKRVCDDEFIAEMQSNEAYKHLNVRNVYNKMLVHCHRKGKQATQNRLIYWLNNEDPPMGNGNGSYQQNTPPGSRAGAGVYEFKSKSVVR